MLEECEGQRCPFLMRTVMLGTALKRAAMGWSGLLTRNLLSRASF